MLVLLVAARAVCRNDLLFLALLFILTAVHKSQSGDAFHHTCGRVAEEFTAGFEGSINANAMLWRGEEVARLWRVVGGLFGYVVATGSIRIVPMAGKGFSENGVERLFHSSV